MTTDTTDSDQSRGIAFFDFDGVLSRTSSWRSVHRQLGTLDAADEHYARYQAGELSYTEWGALDSGLWTDTSTERFYQAIEGIEIVDGIGETLITLKEWGFVTGVVSAGAPSSSKPRSASSHSISWLPTKRVSRTGR